MKNAFWRLRHRPEDGRLDEAMAELRSTSAGRGRELEGLARSWWVYLGDLRAAEGTWGPLDPAERLRRTRELRREFFGEELAGELFGPDERRAAFAIEVRAAAREEGLTGPELDARRDDVAERIFGETGESPLEEGTLARLRREIRALEPELEGLDEAARAERVHELRVERLGPEAARRFAELDRLRGEERERMEAFEEFRHQMQVREDLDPAERDDAIEEVREALFGARSADRMRRREALSEIIREAAP